MSTRQPSQLCALVANLARIAGRAAPAPALLNPHAAADVARLIRDAVRAEITPALASEEELADYRAAADYRWWETTAAHAAVDWDDVEATNRDLTEAGFPARHGTHAVLCYHRADGDERMPAYDLGLVIAGERETPPGAGYEFRDRSILDLAPGDRDLEDAVHAAARRCYRQAAGGSAEPYYQPLREALQGILADLHRDVLSRAAWIRPVQVIANADTLTTSDDPAAVVSSPNAPDAAQQVYHLQRALRSVSARSDGNTRLAFGPPTTTKLGSGPGNQTETRRPFAWWSTYGQWGPRAWQVTGTVVLTVCREYHDTEARIEDVRLTTVSPAREHPTDPGDEYVNEAYAAVYAGGGLAEVIGRYLWQALARQQARRLTGWTEDETEMPEDDSPEGFTAYTLDNPARPDSGRPALVVTVGPAGAGKTTWAGAWMAADRRRVRLGRDVLRDELYGRRAPHLTREEEDHITAVQAERIRAAIAGGRSVVLDETNLTAAAGNLERLAALAAECGAELHIEDRFTLVPAEVCIARQAGRPQREQVPADVIKEMAARASNPQHNQ